MNPDLDLLQAYPFEKLQQLKAGISPDPELEHIALSIGEPKHPAPDFVLESLKNNLQGVSTYPTTKGLPALREAIAAWASRRFGLENLCSETQVLPVNGTREALFSFTQAVVRRSDDAAVLMPNPFYQIYEGACLLAGAKPHFINCSEENHFLPDFDAVTEAQWQACQMLFICSPGNPTGAVMPQATMEKLIALSDRYNFVIASDECYSELYFDEDKPPLGLLQVCASIGRHDYKNCVVFHSLSKRSNLPGLRSGFVAGDARVMKSFLLYRTYHGCAMPVHNQLASIAAWEDEAHVLANRTLYRKKFDRVIDILGDALPASRPDAGFYLWIRTPFEETRFARQLFEQKNITVLPGRFLARDTVSGETTVNPGENHIRIALVATLDECCEAAHRIASFCRQNT